MKRVTHITTGAAVALPVAIGLSPAAAAGALFMGMAGAVIPDYADLFDTLEQVSEVAIERPSADEIRQACLATLGRLVLDERMSHRRMSDEQVGKLVRRLRLQVDKLQLV